MDCELSEPILFPLYAIFYLLYHAVVSGGNRMDHLRLLLEELLLQIMMQTDGFLKVRELKDEKRVTVCL